MKVKIFIRSVCALLLVTLVFSVTAFAADTPTKTNDYSSPSATLTEDLYADGLLLEYIDGVILSDVEREYLRTQSDFVLSYNSAIPSSEISVEYEDGLLTVFAKEYRYTAKNGSEVVWRPVSVSLYGEEKELKAPDYSESFSVDSAKDGDSVKVTYSADFVITKETVNSVLNLAYDGAIAIKEKLDEYDGYLIKCEEYNDYLIDLAAYTKYVEDMRVYNELKEEHDAYLSAFDSYVVALREYEKYLAERKQYELDLLKYTEYLAYRETHKAQIEAYEKYEKNIEIVRNQLSALTAAQKPYNTRTVYSAIMGGTVTDVINRKGDIVEVFPDVDPNVIDLADVATQNLRVLFKEFFAIKNEADRYRYYITNYEALRDNIVKLLQALDNLYLVSGVRATMQSEGKEQKYLILVAQLYYLANAISDEPIRSYNGKYAFDSSYVIGITYERDERYSPLDVLGGQVFIKDENNAEPLTDGYPTKVEAPNIEIVEEPTVPTPVKAPTKPELVEEPEMPEFVAEPILVQKPKEVAKPSLTEQEKALVEAYYDGLITERKDYTGTGITVSRTINTTKVFCGGRAVTVSYVDKEYSSSGVKEILYTLTVDKDSAVDYRGIVPQKEQDADYKYEHSGWTDGDGNAVDLSSVSEDTVLYPTFSAIKKNYKTWWIVDGSEPTEDYPGVPVKANDGYYSYTFVGWDEYKNTETLEVFCTAKFERFPLLSVSGVLAEVTDKSGKCVVDLTVTDLILERVEIFDLLSRVSYVGGLEIIFDSERTLSFSYTEVLRLLESEVSSVSLKAYGDTFILSFYGSDGKAVSDGVSATVNAVCSVVDYENLVLYKNIESGKEYFTATYSDGRIKFNAQQGTYYADSAYSLSAVVPDGIDLMINTDTAFLGETVKVSLDVKPGLRIDSVYYIGADNVKNYIEGMTTDGKILTAFGSFKMPAMDVMICVVYTQIVYTVKFESDGKIISSEKYHYGDTVAVPDAPSKASDEKYSYKFVGWTPTVGTVTGDVVYEANYEMTLLPSKSDDNMKLSPLVLKLLLLLYVGISCFGALVIPSVVLIVILRIKHKKRFNKPTDKGVGRKNN